MPGEPSEDGDTASTIRAARKLTTVLGRTRAKGRRAVTSDIPSLDPAAESVLDEFVELFNARDWDAIAEFISEDVTSERLGAASRTEVLHALAQLDVTYPGLLATRGEYGNEPVVVAWLPDFETRDWAPMGYFSFSFTDDDEPLIEHIEYEDVPTEDELLLAEEPDADDLPEWFDWTAYEEGVPSTED